MNLGHRRDPSGPSPYSGYHIHLRIKRLNYSGLPHTLRSLSSGARHSIAQQIRSVIYVFT